MVLCGRLEATGNVIVILFLIVFVEESCQKDSMFGYGCFFKVCILLSIWSNVWFSQKSINCWMVVLSRGWFWFGSLPCWGSLPSPIKDERMPAASAISLSNWSHLSMFSNSPNTTTALTNACQTTNPVTLLSIM